MCKPMKNRIKQIQTDYAAKGVSVVAINSNEDTGYPEDSFENMKKRCS